MPTYPCVHTCQHAYGTVVYIPTDSIGRWPPSSPGTDPTQPNLTQSQPASGQIQRAGTERNQAEPETTRRRTGEDGEEGEEEGEEEEEEENKVLIRDPTTAHRPFMHPTNSASCRRRPSPPPRPTPRQCTCISSRETTDRSRPMYIHTYIHIYSRTSQTNPQRERAPPPAFCSPARSIASDPASPHSNILHTFPPPSLSLSFSLPGRLGRYITQWRRRGKRNGSTRHGTHSTKKKKKKKQCGRREEKRRREQARLVCGVCMCALLTYVNTYMRSCLD